MKLISLEVEGYKNLKNKKLVKFNFENCDNYVALIGLNGCGKSNILEAISLIFSNLYHNTAISFKYELVYELKNQKIIVRNGALKLSGETKNVPRGKISDYLPDNIITSYSGEEMRLWKEIYFESYSELFRNIKTQQSFIPKMLYVNKFTWEFALISLLCLENQNSQNFIKNILKINDDVEIEFKIDPLKYEIYEKNESLSFIKRLVELKDQKDRIHINTIKTLEIGAKDKKDFAQKIFYFLFITGMPVRDGKKINVDKIIQSTQIHFNNIDLTKLSEGEKKLILLQTITNVLANENTLILLDEPDAHVHIDRKKEIVDILDTPEHFTVFTTHSPTILHCIKDENVRIIRDSPVTGAEVVYIDKMNALSEITNDEFSFTDATLAISSTNDILLVEGEYDYLYILEAIKRLNNLKDNKYQNFNFTIINCGGAGNVPAIFKEIIAPNLKSTHLCVATFDGDQAGRDAIQGIQDYLKEMPMPNVKTMTHTPIQGWDNNKEFYMEDYFPVDTYRNILLTEINKKTKIKDFQQLSKNTAKSIINSNYKNFQDTDYTRFELLLDEIIKLQKDYHNI